MQSVYSIALSSQMGSYILGLLFVMFCWAFYKVLSNTKKISIRSVRPIDQIITGSTNPVPSVPIIYGNKEIFNTVQISRRGASKTNAVQCHIQVIYFLKLLLGSLSTRDRVSVLGRKYIEFDSDDT